MNDEMMPWDGKEGAETLSEIYSVMAYGGGFTAEEARNAIMKFAEHMELWATEYAKLLQEAFRQVSVPTEWYCRASDKILNLHEIREQRKRQREEIQDIRHDPRMRRGRGGKKWRVK